MRRLGAAPSWGRAFGNSRERLGQGNGCRWSDRAAEASYGCRCSVVAGQPTYLWRWIVGRDKGTPSVSTGGGYPRGTYDSISGRFAPLWGSLNDSNGVASAGHRTPRYFMAGSLANFTRRSFPE